MEGEEYMNRESRKQEAEIAEVSILIILLIRRLSRPQWKGYRAYLAVSGNASNCDCNPSLFASRLVVGEYIGVRSCRRRVCWRR